MKRVMSGVLVLIDVLPEDDIFLYRLFVSTRQNDFTMLSWPQEEVDRLLHIQYEAQKASYRIQFPSAIHQIVVLEREPIGRIITDVSDQVVRLVDISLLPEYRGRGFGTMLLMLVQRLATEKGLSVKLHVLIGNPAQRLYARCGFYVTGEVVPYIAMKWDPDRL